MRNVNRNDPERRLKERLTVLQDYAHLMLLTEIGLKGCKRDGVYSLSEKKCLNCDLKRECKCLIDKSAGSFMEHDLPDVINAMEIAKSYVEHKSVHNIQDDGSCDCDSCSWLAEYENTHIEALEIIGAEIREVAL